MCVNGQIVCQKLDCTWWNSVSNQGCSEKIKKYMLSGVTRIPVFRTDLPQWVKQAISR